VAVWYIFSVLCAFWACHWLAASLENANDPAVRTQRVGCWRWWTLRVASLFLVLPGIFATLARGQTNLLLLALVCGAIGGLLRRRSWLAGLCLSGAICLKVFPAFLLIYPLWRRDGRCLAGCALGLVLGLVVIPVAYGGPRWALEQNRQFVATVLCPGLGTGSDQTVARELTNVTATDSQSFLTIFHNTRHLDRWTRPHQASAATRRVALAAGGLLTLLTFWAAGRRRGSAAAEVLFLGQLIVIMLLLCPVCHLAYFCLLLPLVMVVVDRAWIPALVSRDPRAGRPPQRRLFLLLAAWFTLDFTGRVLPHIPGLEITRDLGLATYTALVWWAVGWVALARMTRKQTPPAQPAAPARAA
jgi:hypothetical protein